MNKTEKRIRKQYFRAEKATVNQVLRRRLISYLMIEADSVEFMLDNLNLADIEIKELMETIKNDPSDYIDSVLDAISEYLINRMKDLGSR